MAFIAIFILFWVVEFLIIINNGTPVAAPEIPRSMQQLGHGPALSYVVMGDSTAIGQGTDYQHSYAVASAKHLAAKYQVNFVNVGVSGARAHDVAQKQLSKAESYRPDVVVLAVGANDATHFSRGKTVQAALQTIVNGLRQANPKVRIIVTMSPAIDSVSRFPFGARQVMGLRTQQINQAFQPIIAHNQLTVAPIALQTRAAFLADPTLLASDKFHLNARGYALWIPVINKALDTALQSR